MSHLAALSRQDQVSVLALAAKRVQARRVRESEQFAGRRIADFIEEDLGFRLWPSQRAIADAVDDYSRVAVRSCHAAGKSAVSARIALAFLMTRPHSIVITTAPTARQVQNILWRYIRTAAAAAKIKLPGRSLQTRYEIAPDWYALGFKGDDNNSDAMQGFHASDLMVIADESAGIAESVFDGMEAILTGRGARLLLIGNPTSMAGTFREAFHASASRYHRIRISAYDTPNFTHFGVTRDDMLSGVWQRKVAGQAMPFPALVDPAWVEHQIATHGASSPYVVSRIDAEFPDDGGNTLIPLAHIERCEGFSQELDDGAAARWYGGVDVARFGEDETVLCLRRGQIEEAMIAWSGASLMETVGRITAEIEQRGIARKAIELRVDVVGIGAGVADRLKELGYPVVEVNVGAASSDKEKWRNLRHELWWQLRERYREGRIAPAASRDGFDDVMKGQLSDVRFTYESTYTHPVIEQKADAKKRGVKSPDRAEAQMLAFGQPPRGTRGVFVVGSAKGKW